LILIIYFIKSTAGKIPINSLIALFVLSLSLLSSYVAKPFILKEFNQLDFKSTSLMIYCIVCELVTLIADEMIARLSHISFFFLNFYFVCTLFAKFFFLKILLMKKISKKFPRRCIKFLLNSIKIKMFLT
jgi:hypothetical protein